MLLTQWFDPEPTPKGLSFARELLRHGCSVEVVTGFPNYPRGTLYPGYRMKLIQRELIEGVHVTRLPLYPSHDQSAIRRILNYASFSVSAAFYCLFFLRRPDVMYAYHPPLTVGLTAAVVRLFRRIPLVYDIQDMWPDSLSATGMFSNKMGLMLVAVLCRWVYRHADRVVVLSGGFEKLLVERGVPTAKLSVIHNWCDETSLERVAHGRAFPSDGKFRILFAGNLGRAQALDAVIDSAAILDKAGAGEIEFVFVGDGIEAARLRQRAADMKLPNVTFMPAVPMSEVGSLLRSADVLLVHLSDDPLFSITIPSKTQAYMAVGKPILMAVRGDAAALVVESGCGFVAEPGQAQSIADAARRFHQLEKSALNQMGDRAKQYYFDRLSLARGVGKFVREFHNLIKKDAWTI